MRALFAFLTTAIVWAQPDTGGWVAMGTGATLRPGQNGALALTYPVGSGGFSGAALPGASGLGSLQRIRFRAKSDHDTAIAVVLSEKKPGGGDYSAWFWAPANLWQQVELTPADFSANQGPKDPVDADGKLDLDQVQGIGIFDLAQFFSLLPDSPNFPVVVARSTGTHTLLLAEFQVLSTPLPQRRHADNSILIDGFDRGFLEWMTLGGIHLELTDRDNPLRMPALQAAYEESNGQFAVLVRRLSNLDLSKARRLAFDIASEHDVTLAISLELTERGSSDGPRYTITIFPPAARKAFHVNLSLADFERDPNSPIPGPVRLDPARLKSLSITDISAATGGEGGANTIWIGNVEVLTH